MTQEATPEFSFILHPSAIADGGRKEGFELEASPEECAALAERFGLLALDFFRTSVSLARVRGSDALRLEGRISARVVQSCVVTLDPVAAELDEGFDLLLLPEGETPDETAELEEDFENYSGDAIDIGEIAAEELALAIDPYPRSAEAAAGTLGPGGLPAESDGSAGTETTRHRPFEALAGLKRSR